MCDLAQEGEDESNLGNGACRGDESACCDGRKDILVMEEDENEECFNGLFLPKSLRVSQKYGIFKVYFC